MPRQAALTTRDVKMMETIAQNGIATARQLSTLYFYTYLQEDEDKGLLPPGAKVGDLAPEKWKPTFHSNCQFRLKVLHDEYGYIDHIEQPATPKQGHKAYLHVLTPKGGRALADHLGCEVRELAWRQVKKETKDEFLEHLKWINESRVAFTYATMVSERFGHKAELISWVDDLQLRRRHNSPTIKAKNSGLSVVIPDGFFNFTWNSPIRFTTIRFLKLTEGRRLASVPRFNGRLGNAK